MKILLIDDDPIINLINKEIIRKNDSSKSIWEFTSAQKALDFLESTETTSFLIFLDINMPVMNGWDFLEELQKMEFNHALDIKMLTSSTNPTDISKSKSYGLVSDFIQKPLTINYLESLFKEKNYLKTSK